MVLHSIIKKKNQGIKSIQVVLCKSEVEFYQSILAREELGEKERLGIIPVLNRELLFHIKKHAKELKLKVIRVTPNSLFGKPFPKNGKVVSMGKDKKKITQLHISILSKINEKKNYELPLVVSIGNENIPLAIYWAAMNGYHILPRKSLKEFLASIKNIKAKSVIFVISQKNYNSSWLFRLNQKIEKLDISYGIIPSSDHALPYFQALKKNMHVLANWNPSDTFHYFPVEESYGSQEFEDRVWLGGKHDFDLLNEKLCKSLSLLSVHTHSNGLDALFGENLILCSNLDYKNREIHGLGLLPCFHGAKCNRGEGAHFFVKDLKSRVLAMFVCGGVVPNNAVFSFFHSFNQQIFQNGFVEAYFSSFWIYYPSSIGNFSSIGPWISEISAGEAAKTFRKWLALRNPSEANCFVLLGDPSSSLLQQKTRMARMVIDDSNSSLTVFSSIKKGNFNKISVSLTKKIKRELQSQRTTFYGKGSGIPFASIRGATWMRGNKLEILVYSPLKSLKRFKMEILNPLKKFNYISEMALDVFQNISFAKVFLQTVPSLLPHCEIQTAHKLMDNIKKDALHLTSWFNCLGLDRLEDERVVKVFEENLFGGIIDIHQFFLNLQKQNFSKFGSQLHKNWRGFLIEKRRMNISRCKYCGSQAELIEYASPLEKGIRRYVKSCFSCWYIAEVGNCNYPLEFFAPKQIKAGNEVEVSLNINNPHSFNIQGNLFFMLEDFQPGGTLNTLSESCAFQMPSKMEAVVNTQLSIHEKILPGQYILSCFYLMNGSLNSLRKHVECI